MELNVEAAEVFGSLSGRLRSFSKFASRGVGRASNVGKIATAIVDAETVILYAPWVYLFADCFSVGTAEGVLRACGQTGYVAQRMHSLTEGEFLVHWG